MLELKIVCRHFVSKKSFWGKMASSFWGKMASPFQPPPPPPPMDWLFWGKTDLRCTQAKDLCGYVTTNLVFAINWLWKWIFFASLCQNAVAKVFNIFRSCACSVCIEWLLVLRVTPLKWVTFVHGECSLFSRFLVFDISLHRLLFYLPPPILLRITFSRTLQMTYWLNSEISIQPA